MKKNREIKCSHQTPLSCLIYTYIRYIMSDSMVLYEWKRFLKLHGHIKNETTSIYTFQELIDLDPQHIYKWMRERGIPECSYQGQNVSKECIHEHDSSCLAYRKINYMISDESLMYEWNTFLKHHGTLYTSLTSLTGEAIDFAKKWMDDHNVPTCRYGLRGG